MIFSLFNGVAAIAQSIELSSSFLIIVSVFNSSIFKSTFLCFFVKILRKRGSKVDETVGIIPTFRVPPIVPFFSDITSLFLWTLQLFFLPELKLFHLLL